MRDVGRYKLNRLTRIDEKGCMCVGVRVYVRACNAVPTETDDEQGFDRKSLPTSNDEREREIDSLLRDSLFLFLAKGNDFLLSTLCQRTILGFDWSVMTRAGGRRGGCGR